MKNWLAQKSAARLACALTLALAALCGCEKKPADGQKPADTAKPEVYTSRSQDPAYTNALRTARGKQDEQAAVQAKLRPQLEALIARARAALPQNATDDQVRTELENNPAKYPGWKALSAALAKSNARLEDAMAKTRETVRRRILQEAADRKAVAEGRAIPKK